MLALSASSIRAADSLGCARASKDVLMPGLFSALLQLASQARQPLP